ncbi:unnamed protein product [Bathycoccus prasinos]
MSPAELVQQDYERQGIMRLMGFNTEFKKFSKNNQITKILSNWTQWSSGSQIKAAMRERSEECIELYQPFPAANVVVDGEMKILSSSLHLKSSIEHLTNQIASELFEDTTYISVHWRYEYQPKGESKCRKKSLPTTGTGEVCFVIFLKKNRREKRDYLNFGDCQDCKKYLQFFQMKDVGEVLRNFQLSNGGHEIYLASDANNSILQQLRKFVKFKVLSDSRLGRRVLKHESMETVSVLEQALCSRSIKFLGTSYSTWTTTVWMLRSRFFRNSDVISGFLDHPDGLKFQRKITGNKFKRFI